MESHSTRPEPPSHTPPNPKRWLTYGIVFGLLGMAFVGIILGPVTIYFGIRAARETPSAKSKVVAFLVVALGVFDILFSIIMMIGTIRLVGAQG